MKILVTGAGGQLGWECVQRGGDAVAGLDRNALDLCDAGRVLAALNDLKPKAVINAAAYTAVDKAEQEPARAFAVNRDGVRNLAIACARIQAPLIHLSTDYVFDGNKPSPYTEEDAVNPLGIYGQSKLEGERAVRVAQSQHLILRTSWVFGSHGLNFVKTMLRLASEKTELRVVMDQHGAPTHAGALAEAVLLLARRAAAGETLTWGTYHYSGTPSTTWHGFAAVIVERAAALEVIPKAIPVQGITTQEFPTPARRPANSRLDGRRLHETLGIEARPWRAGLDEVLSQLKSGIA